VGPKPLPEMDEDSTFSQGKREAASSLSFCISLKKSNSALSTRAANVVESIFPRSGSMYYLLYWIRSFKQAIHFSNHPAISRNSKFSFSYKPTWQTSSGMWQTKRVQNATEHFVL